MENFTNVTMDVTTNTIDCQDLTNNGLYMIFIGYIYPLVPTMRDYMKVSFGHVKNFGKVSGEIVSLTEFGFTKFKRYIILMIWQIT